MAQVTTKIRGMANKLIQECINEKLPAFVIMFKDYEDDAVLYPEVISTWPRHATEKLIQGINKGIVDSRRIM